MTFGIDTLIWKLLRSEPVSQVSKKSRSNIFFFKPWRSEPVSQGSERRGMEKFMQPLLVPYRSLLRNGPIGIDFWYWYSNLKNFSGVSQWARSLRKVGAKYFFGTLKEWARELREGEWRNSCSHSWFLTGVYWGMGQYALTFGIDTLIWKTSQEWASDPSL